MCSAKTPYILLNKITKYITKTVSYRLFLNVATLIKKYINVEDSINISETLKETDIYTP